MHKYNHNQLPSIFHDFFFDLIAGFIITSLAITMTTTYPTFPNANYSNPQLLVGKGVECTTLAPDVKILQSCVKSENILFNKITLNSRYFLMETWFI